MVGQGAGEWVCEAQARSVAVKPKASGFASIRKGKSKSQISHAAGKNLRPSASRA